MGLSLGPPLCGRDCGPGWRCGVEEGVQLSPRGGRRKGMHRVGAEVWQMG